MKTYRSWTISMQLARLLFFCVVVRIEYNQNDSMYHVNIASTCKAVTILIESALDIDKTISLQIQCIIRIRISKTTALTQSQWISRLQIICRYSKYANSFQSTCNYIGCFQIVVTSVDLIANEYYCKTTTTAIKQCQF